MIDSSLTSCNVVKITRYNQRWRPTLKSQQYQNITQWTDAYGAPCPEIDICRIKLIYVAFSCSHWTASVTCCFLALRLEEKSTYVKLNCHRAMIKLHIHIHIGNIILTVGNENSSTLCSRSFHQDLHKSQNWKP